MTSSDFLAPIITDSRLDSAWGARFHANGPLPRQDAIDHLRKRLQIEAVPGEHVIKITVSSEDPTEACGIANAIADLYKVVCDRDVAERKKRGEESLSNLVMQQESRVKDRQTFVTAHPDDRAARSDLLREQGLLDALAVRSRSLPEEDARVGGPVRILKRANAVN